ncbi:MAG: 4-alpha-glucanotransferase [Polyangiaceae bacterium]|nr:4-alpha-glucanotransferase [Polyangiaceae bacterium]
MTAAAPVCRLGVFADRTSGILLHLTSLPGPHGNGDLGPASTSFLTALAAAGQTWWQMLPVGPVGRGYSPYDSASSFAGNPLLVDLQALARTGLLTRGELAAPAALGRGPARFAASERFRTSRLRLAWERHCRRPRARTAKLECFRERAGSWLTDYPLYRALREAHGTPWPDWDAELRDRRPRALERALKVHADTVGFHEFVQFLFDEQWRALRTRGRKLGVRLLGDLPMFVAHDSAEVWANRDLFFLDAKGRRTVVAGVPPDAFSRSGQRWGNPLYRWARLRNTGYGWWIERLAATLARFDAVRLDHFIAFHRYWEVPASSRTARRGRFVLAPGEDFFARAEQALGGLPFVAEDLGLVTPEVTALREQYSLPGMRVLTFAFDDGEDGRVYLPHRYDSHAVAYTGTHDNDTARGWFNEKPRPGDAAHAAALRRRRARVLDYAGTDGREIHWDLIGLVLRSAANTAIIPLQDVMGLDSQARMNVPGTPNDNWCWRFEAGSLEGRTLERLGSLTAATERDVRPASRPRRRT